ncbi:flagellar biosynthetic protein FliO [Methylobacterium aerolatum]|uniref:Flagellar biosynthesis protein FliO n=1 Tax=Methylobacterium aerolatum TaxID=418708 RepID=A0ABU0HZ55_9HYPH|nr:flagellar biosynthetic protein FliO [Methylobacterium aerolatum]MDQ0447132.1 hypothetical protein [Methylobacterium aerolatum]
MFGSDGSPIIQYIVIFAVIFTVLAAIVLLVRRLTGGGTALATRGARARQPRLGIVDVYELDRARQLILLRRDNVEHLLLVGGPNDVVVERNIQRGQRPLPESTLRPEPVAEPLPDPLAEAGRLPEPPRAIAEGAGGRTVPPFEMPVVVPSPVPGSMSAPPVRLPLDASLIGGDEPGRDLPPPPDVVPPPAREPFLRGRGQRPAVPAAEPAPAPAPPPPPVAEAPAMPSLAPAPAAEPRSVDPAVLSNMARQLQAAIARPSSAVTPPPEAPTPTPAQSPAPVPAPVAAPAPAAAAPSAKTLASLMASFGRRTDTAATPATPEPAPAAPAQEVPPPAPAFVLPPVVPPPAPPVPPTTATAPPPPRLAPAEAAPANPVAPPPIPKAPVFTPPPARPQPEAERPAPPIPPRPEPARSDAKATGNPFSVEEIEAEFARLLGRPLDKQG